MGERQLPRGLTFSSELGLLCSDGPCCAIACRSLLACCSCSCSCCRAGNGCCSALVLVLLLSLLCVSCWAAIVRAAASRIKKRSKHTKRSKTLRRRLFWHACRSLLLCPAPPCPNSSRRGFLHGTLSSLHFPPLPSPKRRPND